MRGMTPPYERNLIHGQRINAIAGVSTDGVVAVELTTSSVNSEVFFRFCKKISYT